VGEGEGKGEGKGGKLGVQEITDLGLEELHVDSRWALVAI